MADEDKKNNAGDATLSGNKSALEDPPPGKWQILYWPAIDPTTGKIFAGAGRAEYLRVIFEEAGVDYENVSKDIREYFWARAADVQPSPVLAPPVIRRDDFVLCQTPVCAKHLAVEFGMYPPGRENASRAEQIVATVHEYIAEGRMAFHPVKNTMSYHDQVEEAKSYIDAFKKERLPRYMGHFERCLEANTSGGSSFFVGNSLSYVDLQAMVMLQVTRFQVPDAWEELNAPLLKAFLDKMEARPRIRAYLESNRKRQFAGDSFM